MSLASSSCLPSEAGQLVCIVTDPGQSAECRNQAMTCLVPRILAVARHVAAGRPRREREDLLAEAASIVWTRLERFHPGKGSFEAWCTVVLCHHAISKWRLAAREAGEVPLPNGLRDGGDAPLARTEDELDRLIELRSTLDRIAWTPTDRQGVHYFAVLLLQLRLAMARRWSSVVPEATAGRAVELAELLEWCLPWRCPEGRARIKPGWPTLTTVWSVLSADLDRPPYMVEPAVLCDRVQPVLDAASRLTTDVWNQWVKRAKETARGRLTDDGVWDRCFRPLLPDR